MLVAKFLMILLSVNSSYAANIFSGAIKAADDVPVGAGVKGAVSGAVSAASKAQAEALQAGKQPYAGITDGYKPATGNEVAGAKPAGSKGSTGSKSATSATSKPAGVSQDIKQVTDRAAKEMSQVTANPDRIRDVLSWVQHVMQKSAAKGKIALQQATQYVKKLGSKKGMKCPRASSICNPLKGLPMNDQQKNVARQIQTQIGDVYYISHADVEELLAKAVDINPQFKAVDNALKAGRQNWQYTKKTLNEIAERRAQLEEVRGITAKIRNRQASEVDLKRGKELINLLANEFRPKKIQETLTSVRVDEKIAKLNKELEGASPNYVYRTQYTNYRDTLVQAKELMQSMAKGTATDAQKKTAYFMVSEIESTIGPAIDKIGAPRRRY